MAKSECKPTIVSKVSAHPTPPWGVPMTATEQQLRVPPPGSMPFLHTLTHRARNFSGGEHCTLADRFSHHTRQTERIFPLILFTVPQTQSRSLNSSHPPHLQVVSLTQPSLDHSDY